MTKTKNVFLQEYVVRNSTNEKVFVELVNYIRRNAIIGDAERI